jgi:hypothetical protein
MMHVIQKFLMALHCRATITPKTTVNVNLIFRNYILYVAGFSTDIILHITRKFIFNHAHHLTSFEGENQSDLAAWTANS